MGAMLYKQLRLTAHPMTFVLTFAGLMLFIPNYPYSISFFYVTLGLFFLFLNGRDQRDAAFCTLLPVGRRERVRGAFAVSVAVEAAAVAVACLTAAAAARWFPGRANGAGVDAGPAAIGLGLAVLALFNGVFFPAYFRTGYRVGAAYGKACAGMALAAAADVALPRVLPWLDGHDPRQYAVLAGGAVLYLAATAWSYRVSSARFERAEL